MEGHQGQYGEALMSQPVTDSIAFLVGPQEPLKKPEKNKFPSHLFGCCCYRPPGSKIDAYDDRICLCIPNGIPLFFPSAVTTPCIVLGKNRTLNEGEAVLPYICCTNEYLGYQMGSTGFCECLILCAVIPLAPFTCGLLYNIVAGAERARLVEVYGFDESVVFAFATGFCCSCCSTVQTQLFLQDRKRRIEEKKTTGDAVGAQAIDDRRENLV